MRDNEKEVGLLLHRLGVSSKYHGFDFLYTVILTMLENESCRYANVTDLYELVAKKYHCSKDSVERNIRTCIDRSWDKVSYELVKHVFGNSMSYDSDRPTNREYIFNLVDFIKFRKK